MLFNYRLKLYNDFDYIEYSKPVDCIDEEGYIVRARLANLKSGTRPRRFHKSNPYTIINIQHWCNINNVNKNISIEKNQEYKDAFEKLNFICSIHGRFQKPWCDFQKHPSCYFCTNTANTVWEGNNILIQRPDLIKYFKNKEDVTKYPMYSGKKVNLICDKCGSEKQDVVSHLTSYGFTCKNCSDGVSIPEKFARCILTQLSEEYIPQKIFEWSEKRKYDFYLNKRNIIIETHGLQHYKEGNRGRSLLEEQYNDKLKYEMALKNGILEENYIIIDCRNSYDFDWLRESFIKSLNKYFNLDNINWDELYFSTMKSYMIEACNLFNEGYKLSEICEILKMSETPIRNYLKIGTKLTICDYDSRKIKSKIGKLKSIKVNQYDVNGNFIKCYTSMCEASLSTGVSESKISMCTNNKRKTAGGFIWKKDV
jgi:hypothetical protein